MFLGGVGRLMRALASGTTFSPASLFAAGEQGVWYDPSDLTTLFQDAAGTTPVTAMEQPVGLMLDKSKGLVLGSELVTNGTFDTDITGWSSNLATTSVTNGEVKITNDGSGSGIFQDFTTVAGKTYEASVTARAGTATAIDLRTYNGGGFATLFATATSSSTTNVVLKVIFTATSTSSRIYLRGATLGGTSFWDNASVRELPGNHASQTTAASRPVVSARYNLLTYTEQFDNAYWVPFAASVSPNATTDPRAGSTADKLIENTANSGHYVNIPVITSVIGVTYTYSVYAKAAERSILQIWAGSGDVTGNPRANFDLTNGVLGTVDAGFTATITDAGSGWYHCKVTFVAASVALNGAYGIVTSTTADRAGTYTGDGTSGIYIWGADLRVSNDGVGLPAYQRVGAATSGSSTAAGTADYDTTGFPVYLHFDGVDDSLAAGSIDFTSTDKMSVVAGVRKLSDAASGVVTEFSATTANDGTFLLQNGYGGSGNANYGWRSRGTLTADAASADTFIAPITNVLTGLGDISGDRATLRINGTQAAQSTADQGTGNFGNYPLYIGSRAGSSLRFNGRLYGLLVIGRTLTATEITNTEDWLNGKTGAWVPSSYVTWDATADTYTKGEYV